MRLLLIGPLLAILVLGSWGQEVRNIDLSTKSELPSGELAQGSMVEAHFNKSEMALFSERTERYAQKLLDTTDIVREAMFQQLLGFNAAVDAYNAALHRVTGNFQNPTIGSSTHSVRGILGGVLIHLIGHYPDAVFTAN